MCCEVAEVARGGRREEGEGWGETDRKLAPAVE